MVSGWALVLSLFFTVLLGIIIVLLMRILSLLEIVVRAIPLGTPRVQERRPPAPPEEPRRGPVGATASGRHG